MELRAKCATCAGGVGIAVCAIPMLLAAVGIAAVSASQNSAMTGMGSLSAMGSPTLSRIVEFLSGFWGEVLLVVSYALMLVGMWFGGNRKPMVLAFFGAALLFEGMYGYFSAGVQLVGLVALSLAYAATYSNRIERFLKLG